MNIPETRHSLLLRVRDHDDCEAWNQFSEIYRPLIFRLAMMKGMQPADAEDLAQQVLMSVSKAIDRWNPDSHQAKFRTWLRRVADNAILNALTRGVPDKAFGGDGIQALQDQCSVNGPDVDVLRIEYRREVFQWASHLIRGEFSRDTWMSFWLTAVDGQKVEDAAKQLGRTRGSVYASRSRVMKRLKQKVDEFCPNEYECE